MVMPISFQNNFKMKLLKISLLILICLTACNSEKDDKLSEEALLVGEWFNTDRCKGSVIDSKILIIKSDRTLSIAYYYGNKKDNTDIYNWTYDSASKILSASGSRNGFSYRILGLSETVFNVVDIGGNTNCGDKGGTIAYSK